jgi:hypothetical protein
MAVSLPVALLGSAVEMCLGPGNKMYTEPHLSNTAEEPVKRTWTIIGVADVARSLKWYQSLLGLRETTPAHDDFAQVPDSDGTVLLCLHQRSANDSW